MFVAYTVLSVATRKLPCKETPAPPPMTIPFRRETYSQMFYPLKAKEHRIKYLQMNNYVEMM